VKLLLDTHVLLWSLTTPRRLGAKALKLIEQADAFVSAASIHEISIKASLGKLKADPEEVLATLDATGFTLLDVTGAHAARVCNLTAAHPDPFDRLLVAQAQIEQMALLTTDEALTVFGSLVRLI
jgi:PIN domain nuclease of toxin-antitoxin system